MGIARSRGRSASPEPTNKRLARHPGAITICRPLDGKEIAACNGPDRSGKCPVALPDGTVLCAGFLLSLPRRVRGSRGWQIPLGFQSCIAGGRTGPKGW